MWMEEKVHDKSPSIKELIKMKKASSKCDVNIGKKGITKEVIEEIKKRLERNKVVKVRILKSALVVTGLDRRSLAREVANRAGARLVEVRGRTFILVKHVGRGEDNIKYKRRIED
ncbi:YhbY family RNA-binding protein [Desulfurococcaceae archaeon MEX13E-LK6-19]|nr:YhbY family RNA-binding protein [Desulfurococcaceae archaeon MEX13E-LK6-19]